MKSKFKQSLLVGISAGLLVAVIGVGMFGCKKESVQSEKKVVNSEREFDLAVFNEYKDFDFKKFVSKNGENKAKDGNSDLVAFSQTVRRINDEFGTNLRVNSLDSQLILNQNIPPMDIIDNYLTSQEITLVNDFSSNVVDYGFNRAIDMLKGSILRLNISDNEFQKYNSFVNVLHLLNNSDGDVFVNALSPCSRAIVYYSMATVGLSACIAGGPFVVITCGVAIAAKAATYYEMILACKK
jgi:hypothetical protein